MYSADKTPIYNLKAVVQQTALKPDTLRAWERRYGLPNPERTDSGHRLYSQYDVEVIRWLLERQSEGMSIGRAVDLWRQLESNNSDPLETQTLGESPSIPAGEIEKSVGAGVSDHIATIRRQWIAACLQFDERLADDVLSQAFSLFPIETVCLSVLQAGLAEIGSGWHQGKVTVQQEHFASELAMRRLEAILSSMPVPHHRGRILIGCPAGEEHTFPPLLLSVLLRRHGFDVVYLGANVPLRSMEVTIGATRPKLVIMTSQQLHTAASLLEMAELLQERGIPFAFGGLIFRTIPGLSNVIPGQYLGNSIDDSLQIVAQMMEQPVLKSPEAAIAREFLVARDHFRQHQSEIEADIWSQLADTKIPARQIDMANAFMGKNIRAALSLGNLDYFGPDLVWIEELLVNYYEMPAVMVNRYLQEYHEAAMNRLDDRGAIIIDWFEALLGISKDQPLPDLTRSMAGRQFNSDGTAEIKL